MKKGKTAFQKIIEKHLLRTLPDGSMVLRLDWVWGHEITTPNAIQDMREKGLDTVFNPNQIKAMVDHVCPAGSTDSAIQHKIMRDFSREHGIEFLDVGRHGICHAVIPEKGWIFPVQIGIMGDSHTCTHGAFGAVTFGVGTTELEAAIITGIAVLPPQKVIRVNFVGKLPANVFAKDLILALIAKIGVQGATNAVLEFGGLVIDNMSMEGRMTISNMALEAGATTGMMPIDQRTIKYLRPAFAKKYGEDVYPSFTLADCQRFNSDPDAEYDQVIEIDVSDMVPLTTINYSPGDVVKVSALAGKLIDQIYIGSCTNGRIEDLRIAASIFRQMGGKVAKNTRCIVGPATQYVYERALEEGLIGIFLKAGCFISGPTCGPCLGMSNGVIGPGEACASTTNRNFRHRMGKEGMVHLVSPATAALTAIKGEIAVPTIEMCEQALRECRNAPKKDAVQLTGWEDREFKKPNYNELTKQAVETGMREVFFDKVFYFPPANVDTDQILPAIHLNKTNKKEFGKHCLKGTQLSSQDRAMLYGSPILVAGDNFGTGSSREQAVWALQAAGIKCVIASSFARIFENNMFANGLLCTTLPQETIALLFSQKPEQLSVDWENGIIKWGEDSAKFELSGFQKKLIRSGGLVGVMIKLAAELQKEGILR